MHTLAVPHCTSSACETLPGQRRTWRNLPIELQPRKTPPWSVCLELESLPSTAENMNSRTHVETTQLKRAFSLKGRENSVQVQTLLQSKFNQKKRVLVDFVLSNISRYVSKKTIQVE